jgi:hypothetical protein
MAVEAGVSAPFWSPLALRARPSGFSENVIDAARVREAAHMGAGRLRAANEAASEREGIPRKLAADLAQRQA